MLEAALVSPATSAAKSAGKFLLFLPALCNSLVSPRGQGPDVFRDGVDVARAQVLQAIFDDLDLSVRSEIDIQRGKVAVDLITVQKQADGTITEGASTDVYGGSVATVQSVLLRIVVLNRRGLRPLLLLDESLAAVSEHYVPRVGQFLSVLSKRMGLDVLAVSHNPSLVEAANNAYRINKKDGKASFRKIGKA